MQRKRCYVCVPLLYIGGGSDMRNGRTVGVICFQADQKIELTKITTNQYFNYRVANSFTTATPTFNKTQHK